MQTNPVPSKDDPFLSDDGNSSSSSISSDFTDIAQEIKDAKLNQPNEVNVQCCLRPSSTRALSSQNFEMSNRCLKSDRRYKHRSLNLKKTADSHAGRINLDALQDVKDDEDDASSMARPASMPGMVDLSKNCHCTACCSCSPRDRLSGMCPAFTFSRMSLTASLDTGLNHLDGSGGSNECIVRSVALTNAESRDVDRTVISERGAEAAWGSDLQTKYKSLPLYYSRTWCMVCGKVTAPSDQTFPTLRLDEANGLSDSVNAEGLLTVCKCRHGIAKFDKASNRSSQPQRATEALAVVKTPTHKQSTNKVLPSEFKSRLDVMRGWFIQCSDDQRSLMLKELLGQCNVHQIHTLSVEMAPRMHAGCPHNCQDWLSWIPPLLSLRIMSYLDPVSLCRASCVNRRWYELSNDSFLWHRLCSLVKWRLSNASEQKQFLNWMVPDGAIHWKGVFADRYRLQSNWLKGRCNVRTFEGHTQGVSCVQFDDTRIVSGSSDKTIKLWNIRTNSPWAVQTLVGHSGTVRCLHLNGNRLVSGSTDKSIKVWDVSTQHSWTSIACKVTMVGHTDTVRCLKVNDEKVISGSYDRTLKVWDIKTGVCRMTLRGHEAAVLCVQFDDSKIVSGSCDKTIKVWTFDGSCSMTLEGHQDAVTCLQFDDTRIISGSLDCTLRFWDVRTGDTVKTIDWKASEGHTGVVRCLQADSWRVVSASDDRTIKVWNLETGQRLVTLRNHTDGVTCLQFSDNVIVSGSYDKTVKLWDFSSC